MRERVTRGVRTWAAQRVERRIRKEWEAYDHRPELKLIGSRRAESPGDQKTRRPIVQMNFYRQPRPRR
jgi:hypothetical protein